ncbi:amidase family protein [Serratia marcescens]|uniref:amidase family protein n=1 Tax=Serratia marcescens TaxID=615 RepID=UPI0005B9BDD6|nr:amidase family protein [Serratia marcescens]
MSTKNNVPIEVLSSNLYKGLTTPEALIGRYYSNYLSNCNYNALISEKYKNIIDDLNSPHCDYKERNFGKPLYGIPVIVKDNIHVKGFYNTAGTASLNDFSPSEDAKIVEAIKSLGGIVIGKSNMHELSLGATSHNFLFGHVKNSRDPSLIAGGSSGGSAVAVALGYSPLAIGTDTAGSVRIPAALNGIVGFRPSINRYSTHGITPVSPSRDVPGLLARTVKDIKFIDSLLCGLPTKIEPKKRPVRRIGLLKDLFFTGADNNILSVMEERVEILKYNGFEFIELESLEIQSLNDIVSTVIGFYEFWPALENYLKTYVPEIDMETLVKNISSSYLKELVVNFMSPKSDYRIDDATYMNTIKIERRDLIKKFDSLFADNNLDAIAFPTTVAFATKINANEDSALLNNELVSSNYAYLKNTLPASNAGLPAITIPTGRVNDKLHVGFELNGLPGRDRELLSLAEEVERIFSNSTTL